MKEKRGKILIVAGSADAMMNYQSQLSAYATETALNAEAATDLLDDLEPDVIILDEKLPGTTGVELSQWIRSDQAAPHYYSILIVAQGKNRDLSDLLKNSGADSACIYDHAKLDLSLRVDLLMKLKQAHDKANLLANKLSHSKETLRDLEDQDSVTRLYNIPYVTARLEKEIRHAERFEAALSFMIVSIDNFQALTRTKGPNFMIKALQQLGNELIHLTRADDIVGRSWGGEFYLVLPETKADGAQNLRKRITDHLAQKSFGLEKDVVKLDLSFGVETLIGNPRSNMSVRDFMRAAEENLDSSVSEKASQKLKLAN